MKGGMGYALLAAFILANAGTVSAGYVLRENRDGVETKILKNDDGSTAVHAWVLEDNIWYYSLDDGSIARNQWIQDMYYVGEDGGMFVNTTTPDGFHVGLDGAWVPEYNQRRKSLSYVNFLDRSGGHGNKYQYIHIDFSEAIDRGDCFEIPAVRIWHPYVFATRSEAEAAAKVISEKGRSFAGFAEVRGGYDGKFYIYGEDEQLYSYVLWSGSMYLRKKAFISYYKPGANIKYKVALADYREIPEAANGIMDCVIDSLDADGYITALQLVQDRENGL